MSQDWVKYTSEFLQSRVKLDVLNHHILNIKNLIIDVLKITSLKYFSEDKKPFRFLNVRY